MYNLAYLFGGWDYSNVLTMVDSLVYDRRYGSFYDIVNNFTVKELLEIFNVIKNREDEKNLNKALSDDGRVSEINTKELSKEMLDFLMNS